MATKVLPSPVPISAIFPSLSTMPPIICTSWCLRPSTRTLASRITAKAAGSNESRVACCSSCCLKNCVFSPSSLSLNPCSSASSSLIWSTVLKSFFIKRSLREPTILATTLFIMLIGMNKNVVLKMALFSHRCYDTDSPLQGHFINLKVNI